VQWKLTGKQIAHVEERISELFREIALLWLVFAVLDKFVAEQLTVTWAVLNGAFAITLWIFALTIELRRIE
jgi:hypothetical protein